MHALHAARETERGDQDALRKEFERVKEGLSESDHNVFKLHSSGSASCCAPNESLERLYQHHGSEFDGLLQRIGELEAAHRHRGAQTAECEFQQKIKNPSAQRAVGRGSVVERQRDLGNLISQKIKIKVV